ncbi:xylem cysteine peptidase [Thalictrum thalictroides]|uniref:Xylem cysteine peptidase n=1 Tax=Thalictrum thalictroides TaxID=46969 RepID=A0A7J6V9Q5_THATH|nr:xylem cysteine peptidase [Thalictrum thalictroides]
MGNSSYTLALNDFADLTHQEFKTFCSTLSFDALDVPSVPKSSLILSLRGSGIVGKPPSSVDWRKKGLVTPVKNQASCNIARAVSATNATESINQITTGSLPKRKAVKMDGHASLPSNSEEQLLLQAVASQPVRVGICANERVFQFYSKVQW